MPRIGEKVVMTKGYRGIKGVLELRTDSPYEIYVIALENGIRLAAGPSSFEPADREGS
jgi:hypothetical protein